MSRGLQDQPLTEHGAGQGRPVLGILMVGLMLILLVGGAWSWSRDRIAAGADRRTLAGITAVLPGATWDNEPHRDVTWLDTGGGTPLPVYRARRAGQPVAAALTIVAPDGYVGPVRLLVGVTADGRVLGVNVLAHTETRGIGDAIEPGKSDWLQTFAGKSLAEPPEARWLIAPDGGGFDAIAGASTSSRAVVGGVRQALQYLATQGDAVFGPPVPAGGAGRTDAGR